MKDQNEFLEVKDLRVHFPVRGGVFRKAIGACKAVDGVGFSLQGRDKHWGWSVSLVAASQPWPRRSSD